MRPIFFLFAPVLAGLALPAASQVPAWVLNPPSELEMAAGDCVDYSGSIAIDRQQVAASARLALAQQIGVQIQAMDRLYSRRVSEGKEAKLVSSFESSSQQSVDIALKGSKLVRVEIVDGARGKQVCALVALPQNEVNGVARSVIRAAGAMPSADTEEMLLEQFKNRAIASK